MRESPPSMYDELAEWFHLLTPPADYAEEAAELLGLLRAHARRPLETALELGSGGGNVASHLSGSLRLTLTDISAAMLDVSRGINPGVEHRLGDMRTLRLGRAFDAVIVHDAIVYMTQEADLRAAMETAFVHLHPGGVAAFLPDWVLDDYRQHTDSGGSDDGQHGLRYLEWDRGVEPDGHTVRTDYVIVTRDGDDVQVYHDVHEMGIFGRETWLRLLAQTGFEPHRVTGTEGLDVFIGVRADG